MDNKPASFFTSHRATNIALAVVMALVVLQALGVDFSVKGAPPATEQVDWKAVHQRISKLWDNDPSDDIIADPIDVEVIDAFLILRDSTLNALKNALPIETWKELDAIPGIGYKRLMKIYSLGYNLG